MPNEDRDRPVAGAQAGQRELRPLAPGERPSPPAPAPVPGVRVLPHSPATPAGVVGGSHPPSHRASRAPEGWLGGAGRRRTRERLIGAALFACAAVSIVTTVSIVIVLVTEAVGFFGRVSPLEFFTGTRWTPLFQPARFGVLPLLAGSIMVAVGAALIAVPFGLASAIYLSEYAPERVRAILKPVLEVLAGIPTVVYGYFALTFITPLLRGVWPETQVFNAASASIVVGIMILPMVSSLSEDALRAVPRTLREGAYALGATRFEVSVRTVVPAALSGVLASFLLAISRAIGETMAVAIAAGSTPNLTANPLESIQTMTAYIVQVMMGEVPRGSVAYQSIFAVGLTLFAMTLLMNFVSILVLRRFREVYE